MREEESHIPKGQQSLDLILPDDWNGLRTTPFPEFDLWHGPLKETFLYSELLAVKC